MNRKDITELKAQLPEVKYWDDYYKHMELKFQNGVRAYYSYGTLIYYKKPDHLPVLTKDWDYSRSTTRYLGQFLGKNKKEIVQSIAAFKMILEDNPCLT